MKKIILNVILSGIVLLGGCSVAENQPDPTPQPTGQMTQTPTLIPTEEPTPTPTEVPTSTEVPTPTPTELPKETNTSKRTNIPFEDNQLYAAAYLGYVTIEDMDYYLENYLDEEDIPNYYFSGDEFYLIIPRYEDMEVRLYRNDLVTMGKELVRGCEAGKPFIVQCNVSDIFPDVTVELIYKGETVEFMPYISLKDGSVQIGERGLDITKQWISEEPLKDGLGSLSEKELEYFNEEYFNTEIGRNNFLNCTYTDAKSVNLFEIFYNDSEKISAKEKEVLRGSEIDLETDFQKLTVEFMDNILLEYMGIRLEDTYKVGLDGYVYLEEFDAYFGCHGDTNYSRIVVLSGEREENGNVKLQYFRIEDEKEYIVTLESHENGYYIKSNIEIE